jgi:photosystem II stability/assembly factor-like uncharacterized protein
MNTEATGRTPAGTPGGRRWALVAAAGLLVVAGCRATGSDAPSSTTAVAGSAGLAVGQSVPAPAVTLDSVSCSSAERCWAVGTAGGAGSPPAIVSTTDGGQRWRSVPVPSTVATLSSISCSGPRCLAVGQASGSQPAGVVVASSGGRAWRTLGSPAGATAVVSVDCTGPDQCQAVATGPSGLFSTSTTDGGATWNPGGALPAGLAGTGAVSCAAVLDCAIAGWIPTGPGQATGAVVMTADGGATWQSATLPPGTGLLHGVSCPTITTCVAVGTVTTAYSNVLPGQGLILASTDGGRTWAAQGVPATLSDGFAVACPTARVCVAAGSQWPKGAAAPTGAVAFTVDATSWHTPTLRYLPVPLSALACPTATQCLAVGGASVSTVLVPPAPATPTGHTFPS